jgi:hypothetical protein
LSLAVEDDDGLGPDRAVLRPAQGHGIDPGIGGDSAQRDAQAGGGIGDPGTVHVEVQAAGMGGVGDGPDLVRGVDRAVLGGLG